MFRAGDATGACAASLAAGSEPALLRLGIDSQSIGDAVDVVEVRGDLHRTVDLLVARAGFTQSVDIARTALIEV